jgi:septum formation inhibitor MinC
MVKFSPNDKVIESKASDKSASELMVKTLICKPTIRSAQRIATRGGIWRVLAGSSRLLKKSG